MRTIRSILFFALVLTGAACYAQGSEKKPAQINTASTAKHSAYRPKTVTVFHPSWKPSSTYRRRWVYFPLYNFYWDNWRNHYVFWTGSTWVSQTSAPPITVNAKLANETNYELRENEDDIDEIYKANDFHRSEYKP